ncbi:hypothetical protein N177_3508 [Lutibaculum baratangense AMV1]|uniref:DUF2147 domain-containing protein n=1 Tax=Lutibaculum baratangense AMV1 TaxID=631454 RepID=V4RJM7_9HYPH|nr:hypothetical protein N177_3508 [Lutibaculum baratangense AMV1]
MAMAAAVTLAGAISASAAGPEGTWLTESGETKVKIAPCGGGLCGDIVWLQAPTPNAQVGTRLLTMSASGNGSWSGELFNYKDGKTYRGKLSLESENRIKLSGCVLGGLICRSQTWTRTR